MINRPHGKKAGIAILIALIILSMMEMIFRYVAVRDVAFTTSNFGEQLAILILAVLILIFTLKEKDRICYLLYTAWIGYFVLDQLFELPATVISILVSLRDVSAVPGYILVGSIVATISMVCIIAIGALLIEYLNDGSIYNRAFNVLCIITVILIIIDIVISIISLLNGGGNTELLVSFYHLYRLLMIFLFTFFAYDVAKAQLKKVDLSQ